MSIPDANESAFATVAPNIGAANVFSGAHNFVMNNSRVDVANVINNNFFSGSQTTLTDTVPPPVKPNSSALFTGRADVLQRLKTHFAPQSGRDSGSNRRFFLLHGMGGIGKTQICLKLTEDMANIFSYIFWVDASSEETMSLSLKGYAGYPNAKAAGVDGSWQSVLNWIGNLKEDWMLIFDNADHYGTEIVQKYIPPGQSGNILITSRNPSLQRLTTAKNSLELQEMEEKDAVSLLFKAAFIEEPSESNWEFAKEIVKELCCLPLAIDQAGSAIGSGLCGIDSYLQLYSSQRKDLFSDPHFRGASKYERTVYGTWELSFRQIKVMASDGSPDAKGAIIVLQTFAFWHHSGIKKEIFERAARNAHHWNLDEEENRKLPQIVHFFLDNTLLGMDENGNWNSYLFRKSIRLLLTFSLIKQDGSNDEYSVHPLVHAWSRERLSIEEQKMLIKKAKAILSSSISWKFSAQDMQFRQALSLHIIFICEISFNTSIADDYYDDEYCNFGLVFSEIGKYTKAENMGVRVLEIKKRVLGEEHPSTLDNMGNLASIYWNQGRWIEAEKLFAQVVEKSKRVLGEEHMNTLTWTADLALTYCNQGRWVDAEKLLNGVLVISKRVLGLEHPSTLTFMGNVAVIYMNQGRWTEAEKMYVQVLEMNKRVLQEEHPSTLIGMANMASIYANQGRWLESEKLDIQVLEIRKRLLGEEHPSTLTCLGNLASTYQRQEKWIEAETLYIQVLKTSKRVLGEEHPNTLTSMGNLACNHLKQERWMEAQKLYIQVLEISKRVLGEEHPNTLIWMTDLASTYANQERWTDTEKLNNKVLEITKRVLGEEHPVTLTNMESLIYTYQNQERRLKAEKLNIQVLEIEKRVLGEDHPRTLAIMVNLASNYQNQGRWIEAEKLFAQVLQIRKRVLGEDHPNTLNGMENLASTYAVQGKWTEAEKLDVQILKIKKRVLGEEHPDTLSSMATVAFNYQNQGRWTEAEKLEVTVLEICKRVLGEEHPSTLTSMANLASIFWSQGRLTEAETLFSQVVEKSKRVLGEEHIHTLTWTSNLASTYKNQGRITEAESLFIQLLEISKRVLGEGHPVTVTTRIYLSEMNLRRS